MMQHSSMRAAWRRPQARRAHAAIRPKPLLECRDQGWDPSSPRVRREALEGAAGAARAGHNRGAGDSGAVALAQQAAGGPSAQRAYNQLKAAPWAAHSRGRDLCYARGGQQALAGHHGCAAARRGGVGRVGDVSCAAVLAPASRTADLPRKAAASCRHAAASQWSHACIATASGCRQPRRMHAAKLHAPPRWHSRRLLGFQLSAGRRALHIACLEGHAADGVGGERLQARQGAGGGPAGIHIALRGGRAVGGVGAFDACLALVPWKGER